jgi:Cu-Zn family superoxide dismutase
MRRVLGLICGLALLGASAAEAATTKVTVNKIDETGVGAAIGTLTLRDTKAGLKITPHLAGLPPGEHGFHVHANAACGPADQNGKPAAGFAAGGHFDPAQTGKHLGPTGAGHKGDMPVLTVSAHGKASNSLIAPHLTLADVKGHAVIIHAGGDNYSDQPAPLGGGGPRIACGVVN